MEKSESKNSELKKKAKYAVFQCFDEKVNSEFFQQNYISISSTLSTYLILKRAYHENGVKSYDDFMNAFSLFYGIKRFASKEFIEKYFNKMEDLRNTDTYDIRDLTEDLVDSNARCRNKQKTEKVQFSFVTKLLNIMNDAKYPIYDSNVATVFKFTSPQQSDIQKKIDKYVELYKIIQEVYKDIIDVYADRIASFREMFDCKDVTDMRIVDIITWKLGEKSPKNKSEHK